MKILQTGQNLSTIDADWKNKSQNHNTFSLSRVYVIKTENDFKAISANLIDRIIAIVLTLFGNTYESYFAKKLEVKSVQILDAKACEQEEQNTVNKVPKPAVDKPADVKEPNPAGPVSPSQPADKPPATAPEKPKTDFVKLVYEQHWMTNEQKIVTKKIIQQSILDAQPGFVIPLQLAARETEENRKEIMDFLVLNGAIAAWAVCAYPDIAMKVNANDRLDPSGGVFKSTDHFSWRERQIVEKERAFQEKNKVKFSSNIFFKVLEGSNLTREQLLTLADITIILNDDISSRPYFKSNSIVHAKECLEFMVKWKFIHSFQDNGTNIIIHRTQESVNPQPDIAPKDPTSAALQNIPEWYDAEQKKYVQTILQELASAKPGFIVPLEVRLPETNMQKAIMDYLLLQGVIVAWTTGRGNTVYVKVNATDRYPDGFPMNILLDRELKDVMNDRKFQEMNEIRLRREDLKLIKDSTLNREQVIALELIVALLNERIKNGPYEYRSETGNETAGLEFLKANGLIHDFKFEKTKDQYSEHERTEYIIYVTPADLSKPKAL